MREAEKVEREELRLRLAQAKRLQAFRDWVQQERVRQAEMAAIQQRELEARLVSLRNLCQHLKQRSRIVFVPPDRKLQQGRV